MAVRLIRCPYFWSRALPVIACYALFAFLLSLLFGNNQWTRWHYIFQGYVYPGNESEIMPPPGFTGVWRSWYPAGQINNEIHLENGANNGPSRKWYLNGQLQYEESYRNGRYHGRFLYLNRDRTMRQLFYCKDDDYHGPYARWDSYGNMTLWLFVRGKEVSRAEYQAARAKDPALPEPPEKGDRFTQP